MRASVLDISREKTSEADMEVKGVDSPSCRERAMAMAVLPVCVNVRENECYDSSILMLMVNLKYI